MALEFAHQAIILPEVVMENLGVKRTTGQHVSRTVPRQRAHPPKVLSIDLPDQRGGLCIPQLDLLV